MISGVTKNFAKTALNNIIYFNFTQQKYIFLFGPPGVGKGTYAFRLAKDLKYNHISTGDEIRKVLKGNVPDSFDKALIEQVRTIVQAGGLVDDDIVLNILKEKIKEPDSQMGVILDGVPRTLGQLALYDQASLPIDLVLNIGLDREYLIKRLMARRVCKQCGATYNLLSLRPKKEGVCDIEGAELVTRPDDQENIIRNRMLEYAEKTQPLLDEFYKRQVVFDYDAKDGFDTYEQLLADIRPLLDKN